ncbi:MAG: cell division suppressor protein YneA [Anaerovoracaceae bacterium]|jgi:LysM repeat protein
MRKKSHRLKSRIRFTIFITIMIMFAVAGVNTIIGLNDVSGQEQQTYVSVTVQSGDTLWSIASKHMPSDMDQRKAVYIIKKHNKETDGSLVPGQVIKVPTNNL